MLNLRASEAVAVQKRRVVLLRRDCTGCNRYLDCARTATSTRDHQSRAERDRGQSLAEGLRTPRHGYGRAHAWANWLANHFRLQSSYMGNRSATAPSETS